jgi:hypothetical protein
VLDEDIESCASGSVAEAAAFTGEEHKACHSDDDGSAVAQELITNRSAHYGTSKSMRSGSDGSGSGAVGEMSSSSAQQAQDYHDANEVQCMHY